MSSKYSSGNYWLITINFLVIITSGLSMVCLFCKVKLNTALKAIFYSMGFHNVVTHLLMLIANAIMIGKAIHNVFYHSQIPLKEDVSDF